MSVQVYAQTAETGIGWMGAIPSHWELTRIKYCLASMGSGGTPSTDNPAFWADENGVPWVAIGDMSDRSVVEETAKQITSEGLQNKNLAIWPIGTLLFSMYASLGHVAELRVPAAINQAILALLPNPSMQQGFLQWWFRFLRPHLLQDASRNTQDNLNAEKVRNLFVIRPSEAEQASIASFLDWETSKIDNLIDEQERLIDLLKEKRQAVISHAVTKGLNPDAPMKDSGIEWLGMVPAHWDVVPLMQLTDQSRPIMYGIVLPGSNVEEGIPIVKGGDVKPGRLKLDLLNRTTPEIESPYARARLKPGDIVYSIRGTIGEAELVPEELLDANITQDAARIAPRDDVNRHWLLMAMKSKPVFVQLEQRSLGAAVRGINIYDLKRARLPVPPATEQAQISAHLSEQLEALDQLAEEADRSIGLLAERRSALISAAVTGKIDVRGLLRSDEGSSKSVKKEKIGA